MMKFKSNSWERAKKIIPGGNMLLSKRSEMFLPDKWPSHFERAKGCKVKDLNGNKYIDMSIMGIGTNLLGYGRREVDNAVRDVVKKGNLSTLNCFEEVLLAEKLIEIHPWADMARFARTGGEANAIAVRIARAYKNKEKIALCGYHGWHDWYLASNLSSDNALNSHLLPGLSTKGIPSDLTGTVLPFTYNNFEEIEELLQKNDCAAVIMEVERTYPPLPGYLQHIKELCIKHNTLLIFDETSSGFRETFGGLHKKYSIEPDICIFGKALGNGYAITSIIGTRPVMEIAQETFISSTFWTERIGPSAALATLEIMSREKSWETVTNLGNFLRSEWSNLAQKYNLELSINGLPALSGFSFKSKFNLEYKTLITQEMLKKGFLASNLCYLCTAHNRRLIKKYINNLDPIFSIIRDCEDGKSIFDFLEGKTCHSGFQRLN